MTRERLLGAPTPILRSFDGARARAFCLEFCGFEPEHRFEVWAPRYMAASGS